MKKKEILHPRMYLKILKKKDSSVTVKYKDNQFSANGERIVKIDKVDLNKFSDNFSNDFKEILDKLNSQELNKITNYIKTQYKVLQYHIKNNNHDSVATVKESIKVMENFKEEVDIV